MSFRILQYFCSLIPSNFCSGNRCHRALLRWMSCCDHDDCCAPQADNRYQLILWVALAVNLTMFGVELVASIIAGSMSLRADALDFLGDAANYAVALAVVGLSLQWRARRPAQGQRYGIVRSMGRRQHHLQRNYRDRAEC